MKTGESMLDYFTRTLIIVNRKKIHGEKMTGIDIIKKILRYMTSQFDYVVCSMRSLMIWIPYPLMSYKVVS